MQAIPSLDAIQALVVSGGSSGIGANLIRTLSKLESIGFIGNLSRSKPDVFSQDARGQHYPCDLSDCEALAGASGDLVRDLETRTQGPILLINNSGFGSYGTFDNLPPEKELNMIDLNVRAVVDLTQRLLPLLLARGGLIVNISSVAAWQPTPFMATYGASKAFVLQWSLALHEDLAKRGVGVLAVCPGPTESNFFRRAGFDEAPMPGQGQTAEAVAAEIVQALRRRKTVLVPGWRNRVIAACSSKLPKAWQAPLARVVLQRFRLDRLPQGGKSSE